MSKEDIVEITGKLIEQLPDSKWLAELPNGAKIVLDQHRSVHTEVGKQVMIEMSYYDWSKGKIIQILE